ncbi:MAG: hypothetical protein KBC84_04420 [Proteobacteria bacterium]|nr:hypothetical protein [Pseudomonadota bacterium]
MDKFKELFFQLFRVWMRRFFAVAVVLLCFLVLGRLSIISTSLFDAISMVMGVILFFLAIPVSLIFNLSNYFINSTAVDNSYALAVALLFVFLNYVFLATLQAGYRLLKIKLNIKPIQKRVKKSKDRSEPEQSDQAEKKMTPEKERILH